jgi:hypothetical protein
MLSIGLWWWYIQVWTYVLETGFCLCVRACSCRKWIFSAFLKMIVPRLYASPSPLAPWQEFKPGICRHIIDIMSNTILAFWPVPSAENTPTPPSLYYSLSPPSSPPPRHDRATFIPGITSLSGLLFYCQFLFFFIFRKRDFHLSVSLRLFFYVTELAYIIQTIPWNAAPRILWFSLAVKWPVNGGK